MTRRPALRAPERAVGPARRRSSIVLVLGLIGVSVFGGAASPASATPPGGPPVISVLTPSPMPQSTAPIVEFVTTDNETDVTVDATAVTGGTTVLSYCTANTFSGTSSSCSGAALTPGVYNLTAYSDLSDFADPGGGFDPSGVSNTVQITVYGTAPVAIVTAPATNSSDATPTFTGTGPALGSVDILQGSATICSTTVAPDATWVCPVPPSALGAYTAMSAQASDLGGGSSSTPVADFAIDPLAPSAIDSVNSLPGPWLTDDTLPDTGGTQDVNASIIMIEVSPTPIGTRTVFCTVNNTVGNTAWTCSGPSSPLQHGDNYIWATAINEHGDATSPAGPAHVVVVDSPSVSSPAPNFVTNDVTPAFAGTAEGTSVQMVDAASNVLCSTGVAGGLWGCDLSALADGIYKVHAEVSPGTGVRSVDQTITIDTVAPAAAAITSGSSTGTDRTPAISGTGEPGATIAVQVNGSPWPCAGGSPVVSASATWSCTLANDLGVASYAVTVRQTDQAGNTSATSASITVTVLPTLAAATPTATPAPTATPVPFTWRLGSGLPDEVHPGDQVVLAASDLPPGLAVDAEFHSTVVVLGSTSVRADGTFSLPVTVPDDAIPGLHHFVVTVWTPAGEAVVVEQPVTVVAFPKGTVQREAEASGGSAGGTRVDRSDPAAASSFTHGINSVGSIFSNPVVIGVAAAAGLALFLLVAFPAELLNSTISEQYPRFAQRVPRAPWLRRFTDWLEKTPIVGGLAITLVAAYIFGFADPGFGFDVTSFRVVLACFIALFIVGYLASVISGRIIRGRWKLDTVMELKPLGLILTVVGVVLSRLLDFSPGFLLGLILGISLVGSTTAAQRAKSTLVQAGVVFALALAGWVVYSILSATGSPGDFGTALLFDTLVAITSEGLTAVFIGMLPVKFLDGPAVFEYSKPLWAASFIVAAAAFVVVIVPSAWGELNGSLWLWVAIVAAFALVALGVYLYFRFWAPPIEEDDHDKEPQSVTVGNRE